MRITTPALLLLTICHGFSSCAQTNTWNRKQAAVALTYDDALNIHLDQVIPTLDSAGFKGTFYLIGSAAPFTQRIGDWRKAAAKGHELGNHTLYHPCYGKRPGREWVKPDYDLNNYTLQRMTDEIKVNNALLEATDGKKQRTLACPCGDTKVADSSYLYAVKDHFTGIRDATPDANTVNGFGNRTIQWMAPAGNSGAELIAAVQKAMKDHALLVFVFHGVGGEHALNVSAEAHRELLQFLKKNEAQIWVAPFIDIATFMRKP
ncbi:polysaccharide deacetylase family protein [Paraflavitalea sp. CAU 1676]|uniref:polysaccharide deacetylase family protein n=1 Tax=Paraflavitalea sp. CAU 1676 TaxID=3032598 RepID=UPI0023DAEAEE|nr:polysaccharide deacetylase family protein [Paraflavitalea sp. CAU 1676]MDF2193178.1 polysaccharide deacetylase family protein [Paraflavitalea sp. CAU 1676]